MHGTDITLNCKVFAKTIEDEALKQIKELAECPAYAENKIRIMPDTHAGAGCTIGTTMVITDKITPNLVGVDIGCLDKDTEILTREGWVKINQYSNQDILVYNKNTDEAFFDTPYAYIKARCEKFYHFFSRHGLDQMLSPEHKMLIWRGTKGKGYIQEIEMAENVFQSHNKKVKSNRSIKTTFQYHCAPQDITDAMIRVLVMVCADGCVKHVNKNGNTYIELHFRKKRKIDRCKMLLSNIGIHFSQCNGHDDSVYIGCILPINITKEKKYLHCLLSNLNDSQFRVMIDEIYYWDGTIDNERHHLMFSTTCRKDADFVQFALATIGIRCGIHTQIPDGNCNPVYSVYQTQNEYVGFPCKEFKEVASEDGFKYCFTTSTGFFIIRRNDKISITGNCGMLCIELKERITDFATFDKHLREVMPSGFAIHDKAVCDVDLWTEALNEMRCKNAFDMDYSLRSLGSLGGGNHFVEINEGENGKQYLVIHCGSRNLGVKVANYYQKLAEKLCSQPEGLNEVIAKLKAEGREKEIAETIKSMKRCKVAKDLAYVSGQAFDDYIHDMRICQDYALSNRMLIAERLLGGRDFWSWRGYFHTIHNYIDCDRMILRKGAVSAMAGERLIIPMNMRDGSLICIGKGNDDWNQSAPHGAGRLMSRHKAKETLTLSDYEQSMKGIFTTSVCRDTIDEAPMAYKPIEEIMECIEDTVSIVDIIKPVYNFKAAE